MVPPGIMSRKARRANAEIKWDGVPPIGFMQKGTRKTVDIEDCPIGTDAVRLGMKQEKERVAKEIALFRRGATLLLRESTKRSPKSKDGEPTPKPSKAEQESIDVASERPSTAINGIIPPISQSLVRIRGAEEEARTISTTSKKKPASQTRTPSPPNSSTTTSLPTPPVPSSKQQLHTLNLYSLIRDNILAPSSTTANAKTATPKSNTSSRRSSPAPAAHIRETDHESHRRLLRLRPIQHHPLSPLHPHSRHRHRRRLNPLRARQCPRKRHHKRQIHLRRCHCSVRIRDLSAR